MSEETVRRAVRKWVESGRLDRETAERILRRILKILFGEDRRSGGG